MPSQARFVSSTELDFAHLRLARYMEGSDLKIVPDRCRWMDRVPGETWWMRWHRITGNAPPLSVIYEDVNKRPDKVVKPRSGSKLKDKHNRIARMTNDECQQAGARDAVFTKARQDRIAHTAKKLGKRFPPAG